MQQDGVAEAKESTSTERVSATWTIDAGRAHLAAWSFLALINQVLISICLPKPLANVGLLHRAYDAGQLLALGVLSWLGVRVVQLVLGRLPRWARFRAWIDAALLFAIVLTISLVFSAPDFENFVERKELEVWEAVVPFSLVLAATLTATLAARRFARGILRIALVVVGAGLAVANAFVLENDYVFAHFGAAWLGALLIGHGIERLTLPAPPRAVRVAALACVILAALGSVLIPPRDEVQRRLWSLGSSVGAPLIARFLPERPGPDLASVFIEYRSSPWFRKRDGLAPVPPTGAVNAPEPLLVVLMGIDAMRADVLEDPEYKQRLPQLRRLATRGAYFTKAHSPSPSTTATFGALFSGKYYSMLPWERLGKGRLKLVESTPRFTQVLQQAHVHTIYIKTLGRVCAKSGIGLGFDEEVPVGRSPRAKKVVDLAIQALKQAPPKPTFLFTHFTEPHAPYNLGGKNGSPKDRYVNEVRVVDRQIARFRRFLKRSGLDRRTILIIFADHGEAFGEHGQRFHARSVYEELIRVPLIVHGPGIVRRRVATPVTLMDLGPTILDLFGLQTPGSYMGQSIAPLLVSEDAELTRPLIADARREIQAFYFPDGKKVIFTRRKKTVEVYDLESDPEELNNLIETGAQAVDRHVQTAEYFFSSVRRKE